MVKNRKPHPAGDAAEQGKCGKSSETVSNFDFTSSCTGSQVRIFPLLPEGEESAIHAADLVRLAGFKNQRAMRVQADHEREHGFPVLASEAGYYRPAIGDRGIAEVRRFLRRQDSRAASNRRTTRLIRARLREIESRPLPGQINLWDVDT